VIRVVAFATLSYLSGEAFRLILDSFRRYESCILPGLVRVDILFSLITLVRNCRRALGTNKLLYYTYR
jgi:hypothetical protein